MKITLKTLLTFGLLFAIISNAQATEITNTSATGTTFKFSATLDAPLTTGNKVKIDFGKGGLKAMTCSAKNCTLSSNALPSGISTATYKIGIYNAKNVLQGTTSDGTYVITSAPVSNYTKIANNGSLLLDDAKLGANPKDWACTKDNKTGLIWEIKTDDGSLRDFNREGYTNYTDSYPKCSGDSYDCSVYTGHYGGIANVDYYVTSVNKQTLCGASNWRMPSITELKGIVNPSVTDPSINIIYFPNIGGSGWYWSSSPYSHDDSDAWMISFYRGNYI